MIFSMGWPKSNDQAEKNKIRKYWMQLDRDSEAVNKKIRKTNAHDDKVAPENRDGEDEADDN